MENATWNDGAPTTPGLHLIEWANCGGIKPYIVFQRMGHGPLYCLDVDWNYSKCEPVEIRRFAIKRHLELPRPAQADWEVGVNAPATYELSPDGFNVNVGKWGKRADEIEESIRALESAFGKNAGVVEQ